MGSQQDNFSESSTNLVNEINVLPSSKLKRLMIGLVTIALPIISFLLTSGGYFGPEWQSDSIRDYAQFMLEGRVAIYFYPFLIYSMISMIFLLDIRDKEERKLWVRVGLYTGVILALQYSVILALSIVTEFVVYIFGFWIFILFPWVNAKTRNWIQDRGIAGYAIVAAFQLGVVAINVTWSDHIYVASIFFLIISVFALAPFACLVISSNISVKLFRKYELNNFALKELIVASVLWGGAYLAAWRFAIVRTMELYAELPLTPPSDCYIATAAAKGNPALVKSTQINVRGNDTMQVNDQLKYLKCAELALKKTFPKVHQQCRRLYDNYGRKLARKITTPTYAGIAYFSLKPFEWGSRMLLRILVPNIDEFAARLYISS